MLAFRGPTGRHPSRARRRRSDLPASRRSHPAPHLALLQSRSP